MQVVITPQPDHIFAARDGAFIVSAKQLWPDRFAEQVANDRGIRAKVTADLTEALAGHRPEMVH